MKLSGMLTAWTEQRATPAAGELAFDERFGLLVDAEELSRENRRLKRSISHEYIHDPTLADAICDRVLHRAHHLKLTGPSRRKERAPKS